MSKGKVMVVINNPSSCLDCPLIRTIHDTFIGEYYTCVVSPSSRLGDITVCADCCPLKGVSEIMPVTSNLNCKHCGVKGMFMSKVRAKAIVVIDDPSSCLECPLMRTVHDIVVGDYYVCVVNPCFKIGNRKKRSDWCPLKPVPAETVLEKEI